MPRGDKSSYTGKQKRKAEHIEDGYEDRGIPKDEAERRAWATVNKESGGGKKSGSGRGKTESHASSRKGGVTAELARPMKNDQPPQRRVGKPGANRRRSDGTRRSGVVFGGRTGRLEWVPTSLKLYCLPVWLIETVGIPPDEIG